MKSAKYPPILSSSAADLTKPAWRSMHSRRLWQSSAAAAVAMLFSTEMANGAVRTWLGLGPPPFNWSQSPPNFDAPLMNNDDLVFQGNLGTTNTNDTLLNYNSISFAPNAAPFTLTGLDVFLDVGGITNNSVNLQTIAFTPLGFGFGGLTLIDSQTFNAATGDLLIATDVTVGFVPTVLTITGPRDTTITGGISELVLGDGSLVKNGVGVLDLRGTNTYTGATTVNAGTVLVNGSTASANTFVNSAGTLGGRGLVGGNVFNSGIVSPGGRTASTSIGTLRIGGDYTQRNNGTLVIEISGNKSSDRLAVQGEANLDGNLRLVKTGKGPRLKVGERVTFLTAEGGVNGEFSNVSNPFSSGTMINFGIVYRENSVSLEAQQGSFEAFADNAGLTFNQRAVARGLDKLAFRNKAPRLFGFLNERPLERLPADFDKLAPDELSAIYTTGMALANVQTQNLQRRTADLRSGANGFSANGYQAAGSGPSYSGGFGAAGPSGKESKESKEVFVPAPDNRWGAFLTGVGEWVDVDGDGNARGYDITTGGFTLGLDYKVTPNFALGVTAGYAGTGADLTDDGRVFVNGGKLGVYATYFTGGFYVDTAATAGYNSYDTRRSALRGTARGSTDGGEVNVLFGTGYDFKIGALTIGPTASFQYTYLGIDGFSERGSLAPLRFDDQSEDSIRTAIGFKTSYDWRIGGVIIKPELRAAWQHEYSTDAYEVESSFRGGSDFTVRGPEIGRDSLLLGAGFAVLLNERTATYLYYDGEFGREDYNSHNISGGVRVAF